MNSTEEQKKRFLQKLKKDNNGCLIWQGSTIKGGYGFMGLTINGKKEFYTAHRYALIIHTGENPKDKEASHEPLKCKNRACCNYEHLRWDTHKGNCADMKIEGTLKTPNIKGEKSHYAKLTEKQVLEIRKLIEEGKKYKEIAEAYPIDSRSISDIKLRKSWKHI